MIRTRPLELLAPIRAQSRTFRSAAVRAFRLITGIALLALAGSASMAQAQALLAAPDLPLQGIGRVRAMVVQGDGKIVIGGAFSYVTSAGDRRVNLARFNANGTLDTSFDITATSTVSSLAIVGSNLYVGGDFNGIGGALRNRLASINLTTLAVNAWNPNVNGEVFALAASGATLFVGGSFDAVGGVTTRIGLAAFDTASGSLLAFDPQPLDANNAPSFYGIVNALAVSGSTLYVGGSFSQIGAGTPMGRSNAGAVDITTGVANAWDPLVSNNLSTANVKVNAIVVSGSVVYLGGQFSGLNNPVQPRGALGAVNATTGAATAWNPSLNGTVHSLVLDGGTIYAGGEFTQSGFNGTTAAATTRNHAAAFETTVSNVATLTRVGSVATVTLSAPNTTLSTGNYVTIVGSVQPEYGGIKGPITVVDSTHFTYAVAGSPATPATGTITIARNNNTLAFNPAPDDIVRAMALNSGATALLMGGEFIKVNGAVNPAFAGLNKTSGATTIAGHVYDTASVWVLERQGDGKTILGGDYYMDVGGVVYRGLARLNANDTLDTGWNPVVEGQVTNAAISGSTVLIGGSFTAVGGTARRNLAAVDLNSAAATAFNANVNGLVNAVAVDGANAYIGGQFTQVGATVRNFIAQVNATTGALGSWYPTSGAGDFVEAIAVDANDVYVGGLFNSLGGVGRANLGKISKATGIVNPAWNPGTDEKVFDLAVVGGTLYVSGNFHTLGASIRNFTGAVTTSTGAVTAWNPDPDFIVLKVRPANANTLYLAGAFIHVGGWQTGNAAAVDATTGDVQAWYPLLNDASYDIVPDATRVLIGGVFVNAQFGLPVLGLAGFTKSTETFPPLVLFWRKSDGTNASWAIDGPEKTQFVPGFPPGVPTNWQPKFVGDINGDGYGDVIWLDPATGQVAIWIMNSPTTIGAASFPASVGPGGAWTLAGVGNLNGDAYADLVWRNSSTGQTLVWLMNASGGILQTRSLGIVPLVYDLRAVGDFNGDGIDDLLWFQASSGTVVQYLMAANGTFTPAFPGAVGPGSWRPHRVGDFDGDGKADIFWRNESSGETAVWYMNGGTIATFDFFVSVPFATWALGRADDLDFDGRTDLMWHTPASGSVVRWLMQGRHLAPVTETLTGVGVGWAMVP